MRFRVALAPLRNVEPRGDGFLALSDDPWLAIDAPVLLGAAGGFVEITYRASFWDEPVRPVFRFETAKGLEVDRIAAGPVAGAGTWIGRVPAGTIRVSVSPTLRLGPFDFAVETIRRCHWPSLMAQGLRLNMRATRSALLTRMIGWTSESDVNLAWAIGATPFDAYPRWRAARCRTLDLAAFDKPRFDWDTATLITVWIDARRGAAGLDATFASLAAQVFRRWRAMVVSEHALPLPADARVAWVRAVEDLPDPDGLVASLGPGDRLMPHALACLAEAAHRNPDGRVFYADEESARGERPVFKPGWNARLQGQQPYLGRAVFLRGSVPWTPEARNAYCTTSALSVPLIDRWAQDAVIPIRRVLLQTPAVAFPAAIVPLDIVAPDCSVAIVIPTRDQAARLRRAIESIRRFAGSRKIRIEIVDNGSLQAGTKALFDTLGRDPAVRVHHRPGAFNFSALCNTAAAASDAQVLVFLNDDTVVLSADWLDRLCFWALQPCIGAVGAKLTYPDGRLQHIGVVVGMGESAGHFGTGTPETDAAPGRPAAVVRNVSAVTGACLAVARDKFDAVGGFDAVHLPIELSDVDICLKLAERGWAAIVDPAIHLMHDESASRGGATFRRFAVYETQRALFKTRWRATLRDDPYFHPGLSLFATRETLS